MGSFHIGPRGAKYTVENESLADLAAAPRRARLGALAPRPRTADPRFLSQEHDVPPHDQNPIVAFGRRAQYGPARASGPHPPHSRPRRPSWTAPVGRPRKVRPRNRIAVGGPRRSLWIGSGLEQRDLGRICGRKNPRARTVRQREPSRAGDAAGRGMPPNVKSASGAIEKADDRLLDESRRGVLGGA